MKALEPVRFYVAKAPSQGFDYELHAWSRRETEPMVAEPVVFSPRPPGAFRQAAMVLEDGEVQGLMDALWQAGVRPTEGHGSAGQREAMELHLGDMRRIAFMYLDGWKP